MSNARGTMNIVAEAAPISKYTFLGSGTVTIKGYFVNSRGEAVGNAGSATAPVADGSTAGKRLHEIWSVSLPAGAVGAILFVNGTLYQKVTDTAPADDVDFKVNYANYPRVQAGQCIALGQVADNTMRDVVSVGSSSSGGTGSEVQGVAAEDAAATGNPVLAGGRYDSSARTLETGDVGAIAVDVAGQTIVVGPVAHDSAVSGSPVILGAEATTASAGEASVADGDVVRLRADKQGILLTHGNGATPEAWGIASATSTTNTNVQLLAAGGSGIRRVVTDIIIANSSATYTQVTMISGGTAGASDGTAKGGGLPAPATGGMAHPLRTPIIFGDNEAVMFRSSGGAVSTITVTISYYSLRL